MRIMMLAHRLPYPPRTGDRVRAYHIARHLGRTHDVTLAGLVDDATIEPTVAALRNVVGDIAYGSISKRRKRLEALLTLVRGGCATLAYFDSPELHTELGRRLRNDAFDLFYVSSSSMAQYLRTRPASPVLMDFVDVDSDKWRQYGEALPMHKGWIYRLEARRLRQHELAAARSADRCLVATREEEALLHSFAPWVPTTVIPNGVDLDYFTPPPIPAGDPAIVFTGAMDYFPNVDAAVHFCQRVLPRIRARVPAARFVIVGKDPVSAVRRLTAIPGVAVTGTVPDVRPFLEQSAVAVAPLRIARGVQNKILEAMAMRLPVVATSRAHQGLEARAGEHLVVEDDPGSFADAVVGLLGAPGLRAQMGREARRFVESHHSWPVSLAKLDQVLDDVTRQAPLPAVQSAN